MGRVTAATLLGLLAERHKNDIFVPSCKTGPTASAAPGELHVLDAWAMRRSWSKPHTFGYEIKVDRGDFLRDDKWPSYLGYCSHFSFVAPRGVVLAEELPEGVGLIEATKNGRRLITRRKATPRDVTLPESLWRYILMSRAEIIDERHQGSQRDFWRHWLEQRELDRDLGRQVGREIATRVRQRVGDLEGENRRLVQAIEELEAVRRWCDRNGVKLHGGGAWSVDRRIADALGGVDGRTPRALRQMADELRAAGERLDKILNGTLAAFAEAEE